MEGRKEVGWKSVPAFGEWDQRKDGAVPDYSVDFSKIRENRRRSKSHVSIGAEEELLPSSNSKVDADSGAGRVVEVDTVRNIRPILERPSPGRSPTGIMKVINYFNCCGRLEA